MMNKTVFRILSLMALVALLASCARSLPDKLEKFVDDTEKNCDHYTADDWQKSINDFTKLVDDYTHSDQSYSNVERQKAARAIGRYQSLLIKNGVDQAASYLNTLKTIIPSYIDGFIEGLGSSINNLGKSLEGIFDQQELERAKDQLGTKLNELFGIPEDSSQEPKEQNAQ